MFIKETSIVVLVACMAFSGCSRRKSDWSTAPPSPQKIATTNKVREQLGIRQIKNTWTFYGREFGAEKWKSNNMPCKTLQHDKKYEAILWEQDSYYTGRRFRSLDEDSGPWTEHLVVFYDYRTKRFGLVAVTDNEEIMDMEQALHETTPQGEPLGFMGRTNDQTLEVVDKILTMWKLERL